MQAALEDEILRRPGGQDARFGGLAAARDAAARAVSSSLAVWGLSGSRLVGESQLAQSVAMQLALGQQGSAMGVEAGAFLQRRLAQGHHVGKRPLVAFERQIGIEQEVPFAAGGQRAQREAGGIHGPDEVEEGGGQLAEAASPGKARWASSAKRRVSNRSLYRAVVFKRRQCPGDAVVQLGAEFEFQRGIGERGYEAFHGRHLFVEVGKDGGAVRRRPARGGRARRRGRTRKLLGHDELPGFVFLDWNTWMARRPWAVAASTVVLGAKSRAG